MNAAGRTSLHRPDGAALLPIASCGTNDGAATVERFSAELTLLPDGSLEVRETMSVRFGATSAASGGVRLGMEVRRDLLLIFKEAASNAARHSNVSVEPMPKRNTTSIAGAGSGIEPVRVVIIEDVREVREGLAVLINGTAGFVCADSYRTMEDALDGVGRSRADVILTDIGLPGMNGIEGIEGHHYKTAAREMGISINTVSFHLRHIYEKLQVHSRTEAVARALRDRLI